MELEQFKCEVCPHKQKWIPVSESDMTDSDPIESALKKVEAQQDNFGFMDRFDVPEHWSVRNALEKQIPKKPIRDEEMRKVDIYYWLCPACARRFGNGSMYVPDAEYCSNCGQKLDWSDEDG